MSVKKTKLPGPRLKRGDRLLTKAEVLDRTGVGFTKLWKMMRDGTFPRARSFGAQNVGWLESEVDAYLRALPKRRYKGDEVAA